MISPVLRTVLWCYLLAQTAFGQIVLYRVDGDAERAVGGACDFGPVYPSEAKAVRFRARNESGEAIAVPSVAVNGTGFAVSAAPKFPVGLNARESFEFAVTFQATGTASYSAILEAGGASAILTAAVLPALTPSVGPSGLAFGTLEAGGSATRRVTISNLTGWPMPAPAVSVSGEAFAITASPARALVLQPSEVTAVEVRFAPPGPGAWTGMLTIGERSYLLTGAAAGPALPRPTLTVDLAEYRSDRTGTVRVAFDGPAKTAGAGTLTISVEPLAKGATDPAVVRSLPFEFAVGDSGIPAVSFETGTTAGTIAISVELGDVVEQRTVSIPAAAVELTEAAAARTAAGIELRLAGFDNTRTAGQIVYTFYDRNGNALPAIAVDNRAEFARYFAESDAGGRFVLRAVFPVTGDSLWIAEFAVQMSNGAGQTATGRVKL